MIESPGRIFGKMDGTNFFTQTFLMNEDLNCYILNPVTGTEIFFYSD